MGSPSFYPDWTPGPLDASYNASNQQPQLTNWKPNIPKELPYQPEAFLDNRRSPANFALAHVQRQGYTLDELHPYPVAIEGNYVAPPQPVRKDTFDQLAQRALSPNVSGQAPTRGIYTGTQDLSMLE